MKKKSFLENYYKPWSLKWIIQRFILLIKERRLPQLSVHNLVVDYKFTREVRKQLRSYQDGKGPGKGNPALSFFSVSPSYELEEMVTCEKVPDGELSPLNSYFDHVYVVNLERRADRRMEMIQKLNALKIKAEFFKAEDGYSDQNVAEFNRYMETPIDPEKAHELEIKLKRKVIYSPGAWGTLKTYKRLIEDARSRNFRRILCLQDDAVFALDFDRQLSRMEALIPGDWQMLYLGASQHSWEEGKDLSYPDIEPSSEGKLTYYLPLNTDGAFAIGLHQSTFGFILAEINKMNCSFDSGALRSASRHFAGNCYVMQPNLIIADVKESDIRISRKQQEFASTVRWDLKKYDYPHYNELVSVVMPAYNTAGTIRYSLKSLLLQTYKELEIIVVNDGSTDQTAEIVAEMAREDSRIKLVNCPKNMGCYPARNLGVRESKGKYIAIQDADDIAVSNRIQLQLVPLLLDKAQFTITRALRSRAELQELDLEDQQAMLMKVLEKRGGEGSMLNEYRDQPIVGLMTTMFKRELFEELGLFWENRFGSDAEFIERILHHKGGLRFSPDDQKLSFFLSGKKEVPGIYLRIDKIGVISPEMTADNLTSRYGKEERNSFEQQWRRKLQGDFDYQYPTL